MIAESGTGLGFVALVISYVPVLYGAFSAARGERGDAGRARGVAAEFSRAAAAACI